MTNGYGKLKLGTGNPELIPVEWSEQMEIGVPLIDEQHKRFFELAASLGNDGEEIRVMKTLDLLSRHVRSHFHDEEALMAACSYPGIDEHRRLHQEFRYMLADMLKRAHKMSLDEIAQEVRQLLTSR